jgi:hypothetical protein
LGIILNIPRGSRREFIPNTPSLPITTFELIPTYTGITADYHDTSAGMFAYLQGGFGNMASGSYSSLLGYQRITVSTEYGHYP